MAEYAPGTYGGFDPTPEGPGRFGHVGSFSLAVNNFVNRANIRVETVVKRILMDIFRELIHNATPRDTGYARSCWGVGMSIPPLNLARGGPGPYSPREAEGISAIQSIKVGDGLICYIHNNCRYIIPLEYGHSGQAPAPYGIVRKTLMRFESYVAAAAGR
jgi:hypothetical protein